MDSWSGGIMSGGRRRLCADVVPVTPLLLFCSTLLSVPFTPSSSDATDLLPSAVGAAAIHLSPSTAASSLPFLLPSPLHSSTTREGCLKPGDERSRPSSPVAQKPYHHRGAFLSVSPVQPLSKRAAFGQPSAREQASKLPERRKNKEGSGLGSSFLLTAGSRRNVAGRASAFTTFGGLGEKGPNPSVAGTTCASSSEYPRSLGTSAGSTVPPDSPGTTSPSSSALSSLSALPPPLTPRPHPLILLCGPPCSGKGSVASLLRRRLRFEHVSTGDLLREFLQQQNAADCARAEDETGSGEKDKAESQEGGHESSRAAAEALKSGKLVSDELILRLLHARLESLMRGGGADAKKEEDGKRSSVACGVVLEGFPRTARQVDLLRAINCYPDAVVALEVSDAVLFQRMGGRLVNPATGEVFGLANPPPKELERCLVRRSDDSAEVLETRIKIYRDSWQEISRNLFPEHTAERPKPAEAHKEGSGTPTLASTSRKDGGRGENEGLPESSMQERREAIGGQDILAVVDGGKPVEDVYGDVVSFLRQRFGQGNIVERQT